MSKRLLDAEIRYPELEKLALALMVASRKLRPYFRAHLIEVLTNYSLNSSATKAWSLKQAPQVGDRVGAIQSELLSPNSDKGISLSLFIADFTYSNAAKVTETTKNAEATKVAGVREKENSVPTERDIE